jgi:hypothetical protein
MAEAEHWRLAFMLDARDGEAARLGERLVAMADRFLSAAPAGARLRIGAQRAGQGRQEDRGDGRRFKTVDAAIELTLGAAHADALTGVAGEIGAAIRDEVVPERSAAMAGPMYSMVPPQDGDVFLSLAFRRAPGTTNGEFRHWWQYQHAVLCVPLLTPEMLAYDQVHLDQDRSRAITRAAGFPDHDYDAYDNLTWANETSGARASSDRVIMQTILEDEIGHIDHATYHGNMLSALYRSW